ncbi:cation transporter [Pseudoalteromonas sp. ACER1]|jgi:Co/Zn/Cd efflux system component|uniref:cation transporter n=1 Tax=Alteromonadales TaxID=135622 RepID=UPI00044E0D1F|nr:MULTISPECIES: cation transporter [Alteromonadales]MDC3190952.1 cation transporter [Pseudoalteromonas elyakovii]EWH04321.1 membrane protein [Pseudoalteromonas lipolytica SCSIO 04301]KPZ66881.1 Cadmium, cobalt and zinc/H(+)-K(+) antiporter [Pseudoalteromonas sp. P1-26]MCF2849637.1 cation transporter [Pseudoalteromonas sp. PAST1]MCF2918449.1 cation transporter [Pseudoalteromonas sp. Cn5-37]|tara:strand:+ start:5160 stop:5777 length:618 start_codon:yes stop_codon:yes gene_type:complete
MSGCGCEVEIKDQSQRQVLYWLLGINATMFVIEMGIGLLAHSTALIADSLDMLADAVVYGVALYAIGKSLLHKANAARISGFFQMALGVLIIIDIVRRSIYGSEPVSGLMMAMGAVALVANVICLVIIRKQRNEEVHMRASWIFSANDVIANLGVIFAGVLVFWLDSRWPDLVIGVIVSCVVLRGAKMILEDAGNERQRALNAQS